MVGDALALLAALLDTFYYIGAKRLRLRLPLPIFFCALFGTLTPMGPHPDPHPPWDPTLILTLHRTPP
jgi:drug/metabolite transporter (DMT)-like permease